ncbi:LOW QUALITY PROTEIN: phosphoinositide 3-kinase regulatory subunit 5 [Erpetoichthys calabaricus]|uniref:LOW QUALITY PROTEIN: phosphoinositide 3-kinase regulatory subunit 5 n=1 Tax=Erpetoichthys calabaricus TaxID=27687 RepID=UPI002234934B|nr:LOW QUALITY PROTEIN: phosphoinositide 3-kinase regulatory subunit 5 [Erpetoichthys calabaricus]
MQHTSCTEDRIHHALERCLHGLGRAASLAESWTVLNSIATLCMNRWSLEELVSRDPENFLILLQQILKRAKEIQDTCEYKLVIPLNLMFFSTLLRTPFFPWDGQLLREAYHVFYGFLTWPEPYCSVSQDLLTIIQEEMKAPGISYHRLVREEQGLTTNSCHNKTITVLLMNMDDIPSEFQVVTEQLSSITYSKADSYITLIQHAFQSVFGNRISLRQMKKELESKTLEELSRFFMEVSEVLETAAGWPDYMNARQLVETKLEQLSAEMGIEVLNSCAMEGLKSRHTLQTIQLPVAKCLKYHWDKDNFDVLNEILLNECNVPSTNSAQPDVEDDVDNDQEDIEEDVEMTCIDHRASTISTYSTVSTASKDSMFSTYSIASNHSAPSISSFASGVDSDFCEDTDEETRHERQTKNKPTLTRRLSRLFKHRRSTTLRRTESLGNPESRNSLPFKSQRSNSLPQQVRLQSAERQFLRNAFYRRRPFLSCDEESKTTRVRVVVFGADQISGKIARAYSNLRLQESSCPHLTRYFKLQFFYVPVKRSLGISPLGQPSMPSNLSDSPSKSAAQLESSLTLPEDSTNDIAHYIGALDPWYNCNVLSLLNLPTDVLCQQASKPEAVCQNGSKEKLPILADMVLYYCRHATRAVLVQLYQAELTLAGGEKRREVFIHSLELGHTAGIRAIKASGPGSKRFGIDGDREAVPLTLHIVYSKVAVSGRSQCITVDKVCTSINFTKACRRPEELDSKMECLQLTMMEVIKRQNSKSKMGYNQQIHASQVKVDKVQVVGGSNTTFAVCFDQDEKKIVQSVTQCEVSVCYKPESSINWRDRKPPPLQMQFQQSDVCSLLCLPISTFSGALF